MTHASLRAHVRIIEDSFGLQVPCAPEAYARSCEEITRDGNGVVRVSGWYRKLVPDARSEADAIPRAQEIVAKLCGAPLTAHGITSIESNDVRREKRE